MSALINPELINVDAEYVLHNESYALASIFTRPETFEEVLPEAYAYAEAVAEKLVRTPEAIEEVVQDSVIRAWNHYDQFEGSSKLSTWLFRIVHNCAVTHLTRNSRHLGHNISLESFTPKEASFIAQNDGAEHFTPYTDGPFRISVDPDSEDWENALIDRVLIDEAMDQLRDPYRNIIRLYDFYGFEHEEIARMLEITHNNSKQRLFRARGYMQKLVGSSDLLGVVQVDSDIPTTIAEENEGVSESVIQNKKPWQVRDNIWYMDGQGFVDKEGNPMLGVPEEIELS